jgi:hypothetical protein
MIGPGKLLYELIFPNEGYLNVICGTPDRRDRANDTMPLMTIDELLPYINRRMPAEKRTELCTDHDADGNQRFYFQDEQIALAKAGRDIYEWAIVARPYNGPTKPHPEMPGVLVKTQ